MKYEVQEKKVWPNPNEFEIPTGLFNLCIFYRWLVIMSKAICASIFYTSHIHNSIYKAEMSL